MLKQMWLTCLGCGIRSILLQVRAVLQPIPFQPLMRPDLRFQINLFHFLCQWKTRQVTTTTFKKLFIFLKPSWLLFQLYSPYYAITIPWDIQIVIN